MCKTRRDDSFLLPKCFCFFFKGPKTLWRASLLQRVSIEGLTPLPRVDNRTIYAHATDTKKQKKGTSQCQYVRRCGSVWFRDVLLWYDHGWIPVLVVLLKKKTKKKTVSRTQQTKTSEETSKHTHCNASCWGERIMERTTKHKYHILFICFLFFPPIY